MSFSVLSCLLLVPNQFSLLLFTKITKISESRYLSPIIYFHARFFFHYYCLPRHIAVFFYPFINKRKSLRQLPKAPVFIFSYLTFSITVCITFLPFAFIECQSILPTLLLTCVQVLSMVIHLPQQSQRNHCNLQ